MQRRFFAMYYFMRETEQESIRAPNFPNNFGKLPEHKRGMLLDSERGKSDELGRVCLEYFLLSVCSLINFKAST
jgi:hypothetical protein